MSGQLLVVATPIGNLSDVSARMRESLESCDLILAEDTRHSARLLAHFSIKKPLSALHDHNEEQVLGRYVERLLAGECIALISDAGTPCMSDPGFRLVRAAHAAGVRVSPIPGASAVIAAVSVAGIATDRFCFEGFLPAKQQARLTKLQALEMETRSLVFFESVHRVEEMMIDCAAVFGAARVASIARELTKRHEQVVCSTLGELVHDLGTGAITLKGEFVVVIGGADKRENPAIVTGERILETLLGEGISVKQAAKIAAVLSGAARNELYQLALDKSKSAP